MDGKTTFDTDSIDPTDRYKLLIGLVVPRPIGWVGTVSADGILNLAPYSFFNVVAGTPPTVLYSTGMSERIKDSLTNARDTGEFTLNVVTEDLLEAMNLTSTEAGPEIDEFALANLTAVPGEMVSAPLVSEAKGNLECRVTEIVELGDPPRNAVVFGEVVRIHVKPEVLDGTRIDHEALRAVGRMAGDTYCRTTEIIRLTRP
jgi:flavin reductase (DIM6/NTAB) family NADH-FMN oxidoreductase RutF